MKRSLLEYHKIVIKIGSSLIYNVKDNKINSAWLNSLTNDICALINDGKKIVIVSSGAVAAGRSTFNFGNNALKVEEKQAAASVGQVKLAKAWEMAFKNHKENIEIGQILLTVHDTENRRSYLNARATINTLLKHDIIPIINENDTVATHELRYGDNDRLAAGVAGMIDADALVLLTDIDGLYDTPPNLNKNAKKIDDVIEITEEIEAMAGSANSYLSSGGMRSKIEAAKIASKAGVNMLITSGLKNNPLDVFISNNKNSAEIKEGTWFHASITPQNARKTWIMGQVQSKGKLFIDKGAENALKKGMSLLPAGVTDIKGNFHRGDTVSIINSDNKEVAKGVVAYDYSDAKKIIGLNSKEVEQILGSSERATIVHRNEMVIL